MSLPSPPPACIPCPDPDALCRFCFDESTPSNPLITPCSCSGSSAYLHLSCLRKWQRMVLIDQVRKLSEFHEVMSQDLNICLLHALTYNFFAEPYFARALNLVLICLYEQLALANPPRLLRRRRPPPHLQCLQDTVHLPPPDPGRTYAVIHRRRDSEPHQRQ